MNIEKRIRKNQNIYFLEFATKNLYSKQPPIYIPIHKHSIHTYTNMNDDLSRFHCIRYRMRKNVEN